MHKFGMSEEEAKQEVSNYSKRASLKNLQRPLEERKKDSWRCKEYYMHKFGMSEEEAKQEVSKNQIQFSLEICVKKHGVSKGREIWQRRQDLWQNTLDNKTEEEKKILNKAKNNKTLKEWQKKYGEIEGRKMFVDFLQKNHYVVIENEEQHKNYLLSKIQPFDVYMPVKNFIKKHICELQFQLYTKPKNLVEWLNSFINFQNSEREISFHGNSGYGLAYNMYTKEGKLLRSSNEILFYHLLRENNFVENKDFYIEKIYSNSNKRCDFYLTELQEYIELAGQDTEEYKQLMLYKQSTFGSVVLSNQRDYLLFIQSYILRCKQI